MKKPFDRVKLFQLYTLCNILADTQVRHLSYIKRKYLESAIAFDETFSLLEGLKIVKCDSDELFLSEKFSMPNNSMPDFKMKLLKIMFSSNGDLSEELKSFCINFKSESDQLSFKATDLQKIQFSDMRNLLLELEFISTSADNSTYLVNPDYTDLFIKQFSRRTFSPESLNKRQALNDSIGLIAEKAVINYEIKRLIDISVQPHEIEHTSQEDVLAGYDIKSFENHLDKNLNRIERFIEVKAVAIQDFKFYWSKNEIEVAKVFGEKYFLYLLPVISNDTFDFEKIIIVNNPFKNVYLNGGEWKKEEESVSFSKYLRNN